MNTEANKRIDAVLADAVARLAEVSESARLDAEILLARTIDMPRSYLFAHPEDELDERSFERFAALLKRRADGEPMAYIMGTREFWSHELIVNAATLVPRPETELLVDLALREIPRKADWRILDLGTGSGAIAIALASERLLCEITATDVSPAALAVAAENARHLCLGNLTFLEGRWTDPSRVSDSTSSSAIHRTCAPTTRRCASCATSPGRRWSQARMASMTFAHWPRNAPVFSSLTACCCWNTVPTSRTRLLRFSRRLAGPTSSVTATMPVCRA